MPDVLTVSNLYRIKKAQQTCMMAISHTVCSTLLYETMLKIRCAQNDNAQKWCGGRGGSQLNAIGVVFYSTCFLSAIKSKRSNVV